MAEARAGDPVEVVTIGEVLVALIAQGGVPLADATTLERHVVGAEANVAVGLARLGRRVAFVGRVGADGFGTAAVRRLRGEGVDVTCLTVDPAAPTGLLIRELRAPGPSEVVYHRAGSAGSRVGPADVEAAAGLIASARWLHLTGITPAISDTAAAAVRRAVELAREGGLTISLDLNLRRKLWSDETAAPVLRELARDADVVLGGPDEIQVVTAADVDDPAALAAALLELGPRLAVIKLGADGALGLARDGAAVHRPGLSIPAVRDPVGAGDAFCAGFIAAQLEGVPLERALDEANACGAAAVVAVGDLTGLPDQTELARLLAAGGPDTIR
jgi:2-dehydro-3-deoxygluconokinase